MREILFRAKVRGGYAESHPTLKPGDWVEGGIATIGPHIITQCFECVPVIRDTVGEYTGLTDKNGVHIFEGDVVRIVHLGLEFIGVVWYDNRSTRFLATNDRANTFDVLRAEAGNVLRAEAEVIGNIHDNPDLLN